MFFSLWAHAVRRPCSRAIPSAGIRMLISSAMIAITTNSSMSVKPLWFRMADLSPGLSMTDYRRKQSHADSMPYSIPFRQEYPKFNHEIRRLSGCVAFAFVSVCESSRPSMPSDSPGPGS